MRPYGWIMWFLEIDIFVRMLIACILMAAAAFAMRKAGKSPTDVIRFMLPIDILLILYVEWRLCVFYVVYLLVTYVFTQLIIKIKRGRKAWFVVLCVLCASPLLYSRLTTFFDFLPLYFALTGIAYNMLKAIDAVYFAYYTDRKIPFLTYANFILFIPTFTAGPIFRYRDFEKTYNKPEGITMQTAEVCVKRLIRGFFKKMVVLAFVYIAVERLLECSMHWYISVVIMALSYCILYLDMSGYADIAIALGGIMGIKVPENFKKPLKAASFTQFWRNWHVTLCDWIREHIFVVLNGKKITRPIGAAIGFFTMMFMSLWHGCTLIYVIDGFFNGAILALENLLGLTTVDRRKTSRAYYVFRCLLTNAIFAFNTLFYTLTADELYAVLRGFITL